MFQLDEGGPSLTSPSSLKGALPFQVKSRKCLRVIPLLWQLLLGPPRGCQSSCPPPPHAQAPPTCPCWDPGSVDLCQQLAGRQKSEGRSCVNTPPLCLRGEPRASPRPASMQPAAKSFPCSRPFSGSLVPVARPARFSLPVRVHLAGLSSHSLPAVPWARVTGGSFRLPNGLCSVSPLPATRSQLQPG